MDSVHEAVELYTKGRRMILEGEGKMKQAYDLMKDFDEYQKDHFFKCTEVDVDGRPKHTADGGQRRKAETPVF